MRTILVAMVLVACETPAAHEWPDAGHAVPAACETDGQPPVCPAHYTLCVRHAGVRVRRRLAQRRDRLLHRQQPAGLRAPALGSQLHTGDVRHRAGAHMQHGKRGAVADGACRTRSQSAARPGEMAASTSWRERPGAHGRVRERRATHAVGAVCVPPASDVDVCADATQVEGTRYPSQPSTRTRARWSRWWP